MIKNLILIPLFLLIPLSGMAGSKSRFSDHFTDNTLRIDYYHIGDAKSEQIVLDQIYKQNIWAGPADKADQPINLGKYFYKVYDKKSEQLIYAKGFDAYFAEYQTTGRAIDGIKRSYHESALIPFPKDSIRFVIEKRDRKQKLFPIYDIAIDPADYHIITKSTGHKVEIIPVLSNGSPRDHVDIVFLSEGYTEDQRDRYIFDLKRFTDSLFAWEPYKVWQNKFNVTGLFVASADSGVDEPRKNIYKNTVFECSFNSLDSDRYLLTENNKAIRDHAGVVPYDAIFIMVNIKRYGGGGIFNNYCTFTNDGPRADFVFHHEFGHSFAGLADEYFSDDGTYNEFYPPGLEPLEANITALLDPALLKWKDFVSPGIEIPTPWNREEYELITGKYEILDEEHEKKMIELRSRNAVQQEISDEDTDYRNKLDQVRIEISEFFENHPLKGKTGAFQGAGYDAERFYRPTINSIMHRFSRDEKTFYPVNEAAIINTIKYYTD